MIEVDRIDKHLRSTVTEIARLRKMAQDQKWAHRRAEELDDLKELLNEVRRDQRMRGPDGKRIDR